MAVGKDTRFKKGQIPWNKKEPIHKQCVKCNKHFTVNPARMKTAKFCSVSCAASARMMGNKNGVGKTPWHAGTTGKMPTGPDHYNWKGGSKHGERVKFRDRMQKKVFERDNYTCQICDQRGGSLQVDHIKAWSKYPKLRFKLDNCRTLCMSCHYKITFNKDMPDSISAWGHNMSRRTVS